MFDDCIFCKIVKKEIPTEFFKETSELVVFKDIHPSAPIHYLIVPKNHIADIHEVANDLWVKIKNLSLELEKDLNLSGFRLAVNAGDKADVKHLHVHFVSGFDKVRAI